MLQTVVYDGMIILTVDENVSKQKERNVKN